MDHHVERPLECSECRRKIAVHYTEVVGKMVYKSANCATCPVLEKKLFGSSKEDSIEEQKPTTLCCGTCKTTIEEIQRGTPVGCSLCYEVFEDFIVQELVNTRKIPKKVATINKFAPLHTGRRPGELKKVDPALQLVTLHQALNETLSKEEYEQAAWLRDQIKILTEGLRND